MASDAVEAEFAAALAASAANLGAAIQSANIAAKSRTDAATIEATATVQAAQAHAAATTAAATVQAEANRYAAQVGAAATTAAASTHAAAAIGAANIQAEATRSAATIQSTATTSAALTHAQATVSAANIQASATRDSAQAQLEGTIRSAEIRTQGDVQVEGIRASSSQAVAEISLEGTEYSADRGLDGVDHREAGENQRLATKLAWADGKWNEVFPFVQGVIESQLSGPNSTTLSGTANRWLALEQVLGVPPSVYVSEIWTPQEIQFQLNQVYNKTTATAQSRTRSAEIDLAGRGMSADSPIMDILRMGYEGFALMAATQAETEITLNAAKENAEAILKSQVAALESYTKLVTSYTELERNAVQLSVGTLQAIASMVGGVV